MKLDIRLERGQINQMNNGWKTKMAKKDVK